MNNRTIGLDYQGRFPDTTPCEVETIPVGEATESDWAAWQAAQESRRTANGMVSGIALGVVAWVLVLACVLLAVHLAA